MVKIGEFSKLSRISIRMLRHYDEIGLLKPEISDPVNGYRYYSIRQLSITGKIYTLKEMGFRLSEISEILKYYNDKEKLGYYLCIQQEKLVKEAEETAYRIHLLETAIERLGKDDNMEYKTELKKIPATKVISIETTIPSYRNEKEAWDKMSDRLRKEDSAILEPGYCKTIYHGAQNDGSLKVELQIAVASDTKSGNGLKEVPGMECACVSYKGRYDSIDNVYEGISKWIEDNGYIVAGESFNIYHRGPYENEIKKENIEEEEYVTEVCFPVKKK